MDLLNRTYDCHVGFLGSCIVYWADVMRHTPTVKDVIETVAVFLGFVAIAVVYVYSGYLIVEWMIKSKM